MNQENSDWNEETEEHIDYAKRLLYDPLRRSCARCGRPTQPFGVVTGEIPETEPVFCSTC